MSGFKKLKGNKKVKIHIDPLDENLSRYRMHDGKIGYLLMENEETVIITLAPNSNDDMILPPKEIQLPKQNVEEINEYTDAIVCKALLKGVGKHIMSSNTTISAQKYLPLVMESTPENILSRLRSMGYNQDDIISILKHSLRELSIILGS